MQINLDGKRGEPVEVTVSFPYRIVIPWWGDVTVSLQSKGISRLE